MNIKIQIEPTPHDTWHIVPQQLLTVSSELYQDSAGPELTKQAYVGNQEEYWEEVDWVVTVVDCLYLSVHSVNLTGHNVSPCSKYRSLQAQTPLPSPNVYYKYITIFQNDHSLYNDPSSEACLYQPSFGTHYIYCLRADHFQSEQLRPNVYVQDTTSGPNDQHRYAEEGALLVGSEEKVHKLYQQNVQENDGKAWKTFQRHPHHHQQKADDLGTDVGPLEVPAVSLGSDHPYRLTASAS
ncbi:hypothetical protein K435DRAFT_801143 [Dendrothele bispora CBS 962.96]|uniref:Uncharacterized protein n=1 Tax=Dendrothele bispora (strain CBS 962.96) TaxID=1314807 RepID=A0A4S8LRJ8_DENBC|nr:hypothetical protein K435DRAFT_801143 [Dendrothele bispora CBS 962.96]